MKSQMRLFKKQSNLPTNQKCLICSIREPLPAQGCHSCPFQHPLQSISSVPSCRVKRRSLCLKKLIKKQIMYELKNYGHRYPHAQMLGCISARGGEVFRKCLNELSLKPKYSKKRVCTHCAIASQPIC